MLSVPELGGEDNFRGEQVWWGKMEKDQLRAPEFSFKEKK